MTAINVTVIGNLTGNPELRYTATGTAVAQFSVASNERYRGGDGQWQDGPTSFVRCNAWRELADHIAESLAKGDRVIVTGTLRQRDDEAQGRHQAHGVGAGRVRGRRGAEIRHGQDLQGPPRWSPGARGPLGRCPGPAGFRCAR